MPTSAASDSTVKNLFHQGYSEYSPYLRDSRPYSDNHNGVPDQNPCRDYYSRELGYSITPVIEPLSSEMLRLLRAELAMVYYEETAEWIRREHHSRFSWAREYSMSRFRVSQLDPEYFAAPHESTRLVNYFNKEITVYFEHSGSSSRPGFKDGKLGWYIYKQWFRLHDGRPPLQRHNYFGKAICFDKGGPSCIPEIVLFHRSLCDAMSSQLGGMVTISKGLSSPGAFLPEPSEETQSWQDHGFKMGHLFPAVFMVVDNQVPPENHNVHPIPPPELRTKDSHTYRDRVGRPRDSTCG
ncbi:Uu.00g025480.m01.CDS01 [Anthostomella pinea]|uniref:Uu.00g025480.m01.CDS01 n=1 Tax=Anthostomella pinea TaxID=933095 RepID=A0AAI8YCH0_9PEZI|nr:Uu.00g025480.m01.CDS01 [Anthostomella pinea]